MPEKTLAIGPARRAALAALEAVRDGWLADRAFDRVAGDLEEADRRLAHELVFGVLRLRGRIDYILESRVRGGLQKLEPRVLDILRLGIYQLMELDRVPDYAAVSDAVEAARAASGEGAARLTNAVLRRWLREGAASVRYPSRAEDPVGHLSARGSHPEWLVRRWLDRWPLDSVERLVEYNNTRPSVYLTLLGRDGDALDRLAEAGIAATPVPEVPGSVRIESGHVGRALAVAPAVVQDPAAALVVDYSAIPPGSTVADLCAAPGGKAVRLAAGACEVRAFDISAPRLGRLRETRDRLGLPSITLAVADAHRPPIRRVGSVMLDVPCLGTGTLARHPDGRWRVGAAELDRLTAVQRELLDAAAPLVVAGGYLVYSTCSLEWEENEGQVEHFMERHPEFEIAPPPGDAVADRFLTARGELFVLPQAHGFDGAFAARLRRRAG